MSWGEFELVRTMARQELLHLLTAAEGVKDLVVERSLIRPLDAIAGSNEL